LAISFVAALSLIIAGLANLIAGFLGLFPGMFEAAAANPQPDGTEAIRVSTLMATPYGRYALGHLAGAGLQLVGGSFFPWLARSGGPLLHGLALLCLVSLGLELWGWMLKGALSPLSVPGLAAAALVATTYARLLRT